MRQVVCRLHLSHVPSSAVQRLSSGYVSCVATCAGVSEVDPLRAIHGAPRQGKECHGLSATPLALRQASSVTHESASATDETCFNSMLSRSLMRVTLELQTVCKQIRCMVRTTCCKAIRERYLHNDAVNHAVVHAINVCLSVSILSTECPLVNLTDRLLISSCSKVRRLQHATDVVDQAGRCGDSTRTIEMELFA